MVGTSADHHQVECGSAAVLIRIRPDLIGPGPGTPGSSVRSDWLIACADAGGPLIKAAKNRRFRI